MLPKKLTSASCKRSPWSPEKPHPRLRRRSLTAPERPHQSLPQVLTEASRKGSPASPAGTHRPFPGELTEPSRIGSPCCPGKAHSPFPKSLTLATALKTRGRNTAANACRHIGGNGCGGPISQHAASIAGHHACVAVSLRPAGPTRCRTLCFKAAPNALHSLFSVRHGEMFGCVDPCAAPSAGPETDDYGCSFILKPTTPGSSVVDTANPHDFASEIIAEFSRSASPTIHAVPRERA